MKTKTEVNRTGLKPATLSLIAMQIKKDKRRARMSRPDVAIAGMDLFTTIDQFKTV